MRPGIAAASVPEVDPGLVAFAACVVHLCVSRVAVLVLGLVVGPRIVEHVSELVLALEAESRRTELGVSNYLSGAESELGSEEADVSPTVAEVETDSGVSLGAALELDARKLGMAPVVLVVALEPRFSLGQSQAVEKNLIDHSPPELSPAVVEFQALWESICAVPPLWCWQEPQSGLEGERAQEQVQGLALVLQKG